MLPLPLAWTLALLLAMVFGSFLNVCIARLPSHRSIVHPPSHCPRCQAPVRARDNVPILSWLVLRGRCRDCGLPISARYPLVELGFTLLVAASVARFGFSAAGLAASVFCFFALGLLVMDLETMRLPDAFTLPGLALGLLATLLSPSTSPDAVPGRPDRLAAMGAALLATAAWALVLLLVRWLYYALRRRQGLGLGDVKLVAMLAAWLGGTRMGVAFFLAVVTAALAGLGLAAWQRRTAGGGEWRTLRIPLGACLCGGALYALFFGEQTLKWYLSFWPQL
jgi:leader peptidase (prepilin peptidase)/N-methyltransferase